MGGAGGPRRTAGQAGANRLTSAGTGARSCDGQIPRRCASQETDPMAAGSDVKDRPNRAAAATQAERENQNGRLVRIETVLDKSESQLPGNPLLLIKFDAEE